MASGAVFVKSRPASRQMFNLTVSEAHTFYVGQDGWLVHNVNCFPMGPATEMGTRVAGTADNLLGGVKNFWARRNVTVAVTEVNGRTYVTMNGNADPRALQAVYDRAKELGYEWIPPAAWKGATKEELLPYHAERRLYDALSARGLSVESIGVSAYKGPRGQSGGCMDYFRNLGVDITWTGKYK